MTDLPACLFIITVEVDPAIEAEWNRWYDEVHLPDVLACPGVLRGRRYVSEGGATTWERGQRSAPATKVYTTVYELAEPEAARSPELQAIRGWHEFAPKVVSRSQVFVAVAGRPPSNTSG